MNSIFCSSCGMKHSYTYAKPKFCSACGTNLGPVLSSQVNKASKKTRINDDDDNDEEDLFENSEAEFVPDIRKLEFELELYPESNSFTLGSLFGHQDKSPRSSAKRQSVDLEDFINKKSKRGA